MNDLISREALLEKLRQQHAACVDGCKRNPDDQEWQDLEESVADVIRQVEAQPAVVPQVVANISGGLLQGATANYPVDVYTLDFDYDGESPSSAIRDPDGDEAWFGQQSAEVNPDWVQKIIDAPTLDEEGVCGQCEGTGTTQSASNLEDEVCPVCDGEG